MPAPGGKSILDITKTGHLDKENTDPDNRNSHLAHGKMSSRQTESSKKLEPLNLSNDISTHSFTSPNGTGLNTPPPSQSPTGMDRNTMLISPPPEEILRSAERRVPRRPSVHFRDIDIHEDSPIMSHTSTMTLNFSKRKRSIINRVQSDISSAESIAETSKAGAVVTPNPRLRKQTKRTSHVRTQSNTSNSSQISPTQTTFLGKISTPTRLAGETSNSHSKSAKKGSPQRMQIDSPHALNPNADFIARWSRRKHDTENVRSSSIPYEPPRERFTPPREIMSTPLAPPKAERSRSIRKRTPVVEVRVKNEPPQINLNVPPAPPSPSDDPILLIGSPQPESRPRTRTADRSTSPIRVDNEATQLADIQMDLDISGFSSTATPERHSIPAFNVDWNANTANGNWSDSDDDENDDVEEDEGEYTGKFKAFKVPIKADPPTSGTRGRMEEWGRPISPHPLKSLRRLSGTAEESQTDTLNEEPPVVSDNDDVFSEGSTPGHEAVLTEFNMGKELEFQQPILREEDNLSVESEEVVLPQIEEADSFSNNSDLSSREDDDVEEEHIAEVDESLVEEDDDSLSSVQPQDGAVMEKQHSDATLLNKYTSVDIPVDVLSAKEIRPDGNLNNVWQFQSTSDTNSSEAVAVEGSFTSKSIFSDHLHLRNTSKTSLPIEFSDDVFVQREEDMEIANDAASSDESDSEDADDPGIIKIVSNDPLAAARAALILKQHQYDLVALRSPKKKRHSSTTEDALRKYRRKTAVQAGITKSPSKSSIRRKTFGGFADGKVFIPGSPVMTVPELLQKAESELEQSQFKFSSPMKSDFGTPKASSTPLPTSSIPPLDLNYFIPAARSQVWNKDDWKLLDRCFLDERCEMAADRGIDTVVDVKDVVLENVVDRFITMSGGQEAIDSLGVDWSKNRLLKRAGALCRRQRQLDGSALPTVSLRMQSFGSPSMSDISTVTFTPTPAERFQQPLYPVLNVADKTFPSSKLAVVFPSVESPSTPTSELNERDESIEPSAQEPPNEYVDPQDHAFQYKEDGTGMITPEKHVQATPSSVVRRSFGYLYSWLGKGHNSKTQSKVPPRSCYPALPIPPSEIRSKPRGPVTTPSRRPVGRAVPPKDQVSLKHASPPPDPRFLKQKPPQPKRIVELKKAALPSSPKPAPQVRPRTVSSGSVKDLVNGFEELQKKGRAANKALQSLDLKRTRSVGDLRGKKTLPTRPIWKP